MKNDVNIGCLLAIPGDERPRALETGKRLRCRVPGRLFRVLALTLITTSAGQLFSAVVESTQKAVSFEIGSRRELFVDGFLVDELKGKAELRLHHPVPQEAFGTRNPWEGNSNAFNSTFRDGEIYRRYYFSSSVQVDPRVPAKGDSGLVLCYEESDNGIDWRQPSLGLVEHQGSKANNIVFVAGKVGNFSEISPMASVFKDANPAAGADARYKAVFWSNAPKGLIAFKSADGLRWSPMSDTLFNLKKVGASMNIAFWDQERGEYRAYFRSHLPVDSGASVAEEDKSIDPPKGWRRDIRTATSKDFLTWSEPVDLRYVDSPPEELYDNKVTPYHRAPHIYIGFPARYLERTWSDSMRSLPDAEHRERRAKIDNRFGTALSESLLMASRDGVLFKRWNEAFLRPGIERSGTWNYGHQFIGWQIVETKSALPGAPNELSFYSPENQFFGRTVRRYTLRLDGFVSAHAPVSGGELITHPLRFKGRELTLNFSTSAAGSVRVEIQDEKGRPLAGFSAADCPPLYGDTIERVVGWTQGNDVASIAGRTVRLRFILKDADVYAFQFKE